MVRDLNNYTLEELQNIENYNEEAVFDSIILVPMEELHDSGFRCMKGILVRYGEIVGSVGGWCDVVNPNGIGNYGRYSDSLSRLISSGLIPRMNLSMDCLDKSHCIRIMLDGEWQMDKFIGSNLCFYKLEHTERPQINPDCGWK